MAARCDFCTSLTIEDLRFNAYYRHHETLCDLKICAESRICDLCLLFWTALNEDCVAHDVAKCLRPELHPEIQQDTAIVLSAFLEDMIIDKGPTHQDPISSRMGGSHILISVGEYSFSRVHAAVGIFAKPDTPPAEYLVERDSSSSVDAPLCTSITQRWLNDCQTGHQRCGGTYPTEMPTRVLDLGDLAATTAPKLFVTHGRHGRYIALSYSWGYGVRHKVKLKNETFEQFQVVIPESEMTLAHQEFLQIARALGYQYVWIDALCIKQGDKQDWEQEAVKIASVYGNAELTIVAGRSDDSRLGFVTPVSHASVPACRLPYSRPYAHIPAESYCFVGLQKNRSTGPVDKRAWCFQESMLSRRMIVYGAAQLSFKCREQSYWEDGGRISYTWGNDNRYDLSTDVLVHQNFSRVEILRRWYELVYLYSARDVYDPTDNFAALAGVAARFQTALGCRYLAGLWEGDMIRGLLWKSRRVMHGPDTSDAMREPLSIAKENKGHFIQRAPSWSWLALLGAICPATGHTYNRKLKDPDTFRCRPASGGISWSPQEWTCQKLSYDAARSPCTLELLGVVRQVRCSRIMTRDFPTRKWNWKSMYSRFKLDKHTILLELANSEDATMYNTDPSDRVVAMGLFDLAEGNPEYCWAMCLSADEGLLLDENSDGTFRRLGVFVAEQEACFASNTSSHITLV